ncbi:MAG: hypothetical protein JSV88_13595 [Candidatus Aminicenantes bacterium]|nr:MAG: hypothetical protein JSV88_13595 [Candidatus Aminicenantes bacterium]
MFRFGSCGEETRDKLIVFEERGRKFVGNNKDKKKFLKVRVDNCLEFAGKRCDWLLVDTVANIAHFIELKGCDLNHALRQLANTVSTISDPGKNYIDRSFREKIAYAILSRCPANSTEIQVEKVRFRKKYNTRLNVRNNQLVQVL